MASHSRTAHAFSSWLSRLRKCLDCIPCGLFTDFDCRRSYLEEIGRATGLMRSRTAFFRPFQCNNELSDCILRQEYSGTMYMDSKDDAVSYDVPQVSVPECSWTAKQRTDKSDEANAEGQHHPRWTTTRACMVAARNEPAPRRSVLSTSGFEDDKCRTRMETLKEGGNNNASTRTPNTPVLHPRVKTTRVVRDGE